MGLLDAIEVLLSMDEDKLTEEEQTAMHVIWGLINEVMTEYMEEHNIDNMAPKDEDGEWAVDEQGAEDGEDADEEEDKENEEWLK